MLLVKGDDCSFDKSLCLLEFSLITGSATVNVVEIDLRVGPYENDALGFAGGGTETKIAGEPMCCSLV